jgi:hypothetical protein
MAPSELYLIDVYHIFQYSSVQLIYLPKYPSHCIDLPSHKLSVFYQNITLLVMNGLLSQLDFIVFNVPNHMLIIAEGLRDPIS